MYRSPWFVTHSTRPLMWRFLRGPLRSVLIWRRVDLFRWHFGLTMSKASYRSSKFLQQFDQLDCSTVPKSTSSWSLSKCQLSGELDSVRKRASALASRSFLCRLASLACFFCSLLIAASAAWGRFYAKRNLMLLKKVLCNMVNMVQSWWSSQENVARIVIGIVGSERASWWDHESFWTLDPYLDATTNWSLSGMMTQTSNHTHGSIAVPISCHGIHRMLQVA